MKVEWIRKGLEKPGKTQRGLAKAMGVDAAAVSRLLAGNRQLKAHEIEKVKEYLGEPDVGAIEARPPNVTNDLLVEMLKVLGMAEGGPDGWAPFNGDTVQFIRRPDNLLGVPNAYAVFVSGTSMENRYRPGELLHVHPGKPVRPGDYVLVQRKPRQEGDTPLAVVKLLVRRTASKLVLEQHNPPKTIEVPADEVMSIHRIVGSSEA